MAASPSRAAQLTLACAAPALLALGLLPRLAANPEQVALDASGGLIAAALALDIFGRATSATVASDQGDGGGWIAACMLCGSPIVALHALAFRTGSLSPPVTLVAGILALAVGMAGAFALSAP